MTNTLMVEVSLTFNATRTKVWDALVNPAQIKKYMFGTNAASDWKVGSPITFSGEWEGKPYQDKGTVLAIQKEKFLKYNYWSNFSGTPDTPENYNNITYTLSDDHGRTKLVITQDNSKTEEAREHSEKNWKMILETMKGLVEGQNPM